MPGAPRWLDGRLLAAHEPLPPGGAPGVFETVRCTGGALFFVREHLARLAHGARALVLPWPPWDPRAALVDVARALPPGESALRLTLAPPHLVVEARAVVPPPPAPHVLLAEPGAVELLRPFGVKTTRRGAYDELRASAQRAGAFEALVRSRTGELVEGTVTNVFVARAGELATPPLDGGALPGIARAALLAALARTPLTDAAGRRWHAVERALTAEDVARAEEILLTNSLVRVLGLSSLSGAGGGHRVRARAERRDDLPGPRGPLATALSELLIRLEAETQDAAGSERGVTDPGCSGRALD